MTYTKPEVAVLGDATRLIQASKEDTVLIDAPFPDEVGMSYDTEE